MSKKKEVKDEDDEYAREGSIGVWTFESKLSPTYVQFTIDNKSKWVWWNLFGMAANALLGGLTV